MTLGLAATVLPVVVACGQGGATKRLDRASDTAEPGESALNALTSTIRGAEAARTAALVPDSALTHHDARVRRAAARALARIADGKSIGALTTLLSDGDPEVVAWAAFGLGVSCGGREPETVRALVARAASLSALAVDRRKPRPAGEGRFALSPESAIADGLARCGTDATEQTLRAWLEGPSERGASAALALSRLAARRHHLDDATTVALLDAAARPAPLDAALAPFARLDALPEPTMARLRGVAVGALSGGAASRVFAIRALGVAGPAAAAPLAELLADAHASAPERSLAATALGRLGADAGPALGRAVNAMARGTQMSDERVLARTFTPLSAALSVLAPPAEQASGTLATLADLPLPEGAPAWVRRRLIALRCGAASVLAGTASQSARLVRCDPDPHGRTGALATLRVLDRGGLTGARFDAWKGLTDAADPGVRRAAIALIPTHPEMPTVTSLLAAALGAREPGVVAEAALVLSAAPRRAANVATDGPRAADDHGEPVAPAPEIVDALARALDAARPPDQIATRAALTRAAARLGILSLKPRVERLCGSDNATLRHAAEDALRLLGSPAATCNPPERHGAAAPSASPSSSAAGPAPSSRGTEPLTLTFVTDAGRIGLTLDPTLAPLAVDRIATLARSGFYDGLVIQRVVPGLVVQLGDPVGDGYGGAGKEPLPSETSPLELPSLAVGIAVGGRDTASSQIFVTLSPEPELCGDYPLAGWADPEWASASEGDIILRVETRP